MIDFIIKVHALIDCLSAAGECISDKEKIESVGEDLGMQFSHSDPFISSIHSQPKMLFEIIKKNFFFNRSSTHGHLMTTDSPVAFAANYKSRDNRKGFDIKNSENQRNR